MPIFSVLIILLFAPNLHAAERSPIAQILWEALFSPEPGFQGVEHLWAPWNSDLENGSRELEQEPEIKACLNTGRTALLNWITASANALKKTSLFDPKLNEYYSAAFDEFLKGGQTQRMFPDFEAENMARMEVPDWAELRARDGPRNRFTQRVWTNLLREDWRKRQPTRRAFDEWRLQRLEDVSRQRKMLYFESVHQIAALEADPNTQLDLTGMVFDPDWRDWIRPDKPDVRLSSDLIGTAEFVIPSRPFYMKGEIPHVTGINGGPPDFRVAWYLLKPGGLALTFVDTSHFTFGEDESGVMRGGLYSPEPPDFWHNLFTSSFDLVFSEFYRRVLLDQSRFLVEQETLLKDTADEDLSKFGQRLHQLAEKYALRGAQAEKLEQRLYFGRSDLNRFALLAMFWGFAQGQHFWELRDQLAQDAGRIRVSAALAKYSQLSKQPLSEIPFIRSLYSENTLNSLSNTELGFTLSGMRSRFTPDLFRFRPTNQMVPEGIESIDLGNQGGAATRMRSEKPMLVEDGWVALPIPQGYEFTDVQFSWLGKVVEAEIFRQGPYYFAHFDRPSPTLVRLDAGFRPTRPALSRPQLPSELRQLPIGRVQLLAEEARAHRFGRLAEALNAVLAVEHPISIYRLANIVAETALYSFFQASAVNGSTDLWEKFAPLRDDRERLCYQCNGAGPFLLGLLNKIFKDEPRFSATIETGLIRKGRHLLVPGHVRVVVLWEGVEVAELDATPAERDPRSPTAPKSLGLLSSALASDSRPSSSPLKSGGPASLSQVSYALLEAARHARITFDVRRDGFSPLVAAIGVAKLLTRIEVGQASAEDCKRLYPLLEVEDCETSDRLRGRLAQIASVQLERLARWLAPESAVSSDLAPFLSQHALLAEPLTSFWKVLISHTPTKCAETLSWAK